MRLRNNHLALNLPVYAFKRDYWYLPVFIMMYTDVTMDNEMM